MNYQNAEFFKKNRPCIYLFIFFIKNVWAVFINTLSYKRMHTYRLFMMSVLVEKGLTAWKWHTKGEGGKKKKNVHTPCVLLRGFFAVGSLALSVKLRGRDESRSHEPLASTALLNAAAAWWDKSARLRSASVLFSRTGWALALRYQGPKRESELDRVRARDTQPRNGPVRSGVSSPATMSPAGRVYTRWVLARARERESVCSLRNEAAEKKHANSARLRCPRANHTGSFIM